MREGKKVAVRVVVMDQEIGETVENHAEKEQLQPCGAHPIRNDKPDHDEGERVEGIEERLPVWLRIRLRPDVLLRLAQDATLNQVEEKHRQIGKQRTQEDRQPQDALTPTTENEKIQNRMRRRVYSRYTVKESVCVRQFYIATKSRPSVVKPTDYRPQNQSPPSGPSLDG